MIKKSKKSSTLLHMTFPNGVLCSKDESYLIVAETALARIMKFHLTGSKKGTAEVLVDNLPLWPDNLSWDDEDRSRFWVGGVVRKQPFNWLDYIMRYPQLRVFTAKVISPAFFDWMQPKHGIIQLYTTSGKVVASPQDSTGRLSGISGAYTYGDDVYIGSYRKSFNYIAKVPRSRLTGVPENTVHAESDELDE